MTRFAAVAAAALLAAPGVALAHHGWSSYDASKTLTVEAPLKAVSWGNPHGTAEIDHAGKRWAVILAPTTRMEARGLARDALTVGKTVKLEGYPRSDGTAEMRIERITVDGKTVELR
jgi:hypothetical protein